MLRKRPQVPEHLRAFILIYKDFKRAEDRAQDNVALEDRKGRLSIHIVLVRGLDLSISFDVGEACFCRCRLPHVYTSTDFQ